MKSRRFLKAESISRFTPLPGMLFCLYLFLMVSPAFVHGMGSTAPGYTVLYDQLLVLETKGDYLGALRVVPVIYDQEIPVDSFYQTLEEKRRQLLQAVASKKIAFRVGQAELTCPEVYEQMWRFYHREPEDYRFIPPQAEYPDPQRLCNLLIVLGESLNIPNVDTLLVNPSLALAKQ